jgi:hypothetical protein
LFGGAAIVRFANIRTMTAKTAPLAASLAITAIVLVDLQFKRTDGAMAKPSSILAYSSKDLPFNRFCSSQSTFPIVGTPFQQGSTKKEVTKGSRIFDVFDFQCLTTEFGFKKEFKDQSRKGVFLYFHVFLYPEMSFLGAQEQFTKGQKNFFLQIGRYG